MGVVGYVWGYLLAVSYENFNVLVFVECVCSFGFFLYSHDFICKFAFLSPFLVERSKVY